MTVTTFAQMSDEGQESFVTAADDFIQASSVGDRVEDVELLDTGIVYSLDRGDTAEVELDGAVWLRARDAADSTRVFLGWVGISR